MCLEDFLDTLGRVQVHALAPGDKLKLFPMCILLMGLPSNGLRYLLVCLDTASLVDNQAGVDNAHVQKNA
jgi:hypothetical protein